MTVIYKIWSTLEKFKLKCLIFSILLIIFAVFETIGVGMIYQILKIITDVTFIENNYYLSSLASYLKIGNNSIILIILFSILMIFIIKNSLIILFTQWQQKTLNSFENYFSDRLFGYYINQPYEKYVKSHSSVYVRNLTIEMSNFKGAIQQLMTLLSESIILILICCFLVYIDPIASLIIFLIICFFSSFYLFGPINNFLKKWSKQRLHFTNKYTKYLIQGLASVKEIRVYQSENEARSDHYDNKKNVNDLTRYLVVLNSIPRNLLEVITIFILCSCIAYFLINEKSLINIIPLVGVYLAAAYKFLPSIVKILNSLTTLKFLNASVNHISNELKKTKIMEKQDIKNKTDLIKTFKEIEFKNVSFSYMGTKKKIFKNVSIKIKKSEIIGIKGESGSGKSTFINLMLGLLKPTSGQILINNKELGKLNKSWLKILSYVPQGIYITDNNVFRNVGFGKKTYEIDKSKVISTLKKLKIYKDIKSKGINKNLGERGSTFSGGQAQRIVLARALYKNPEIIFLDEATNGLDKKNEQNIFKLLLKLKGKKTLIISSHNQELLNICDYVFEVEKGKIYKKYKVENYIE
jgi:ATP-binding cassette, subfamily B, bacterial PglK